MDFDDLVELAPPPNRVGRCEGGRERHLTEGAVMMAYAMHLLRTTSAREVLVHPDGEHGKRFDFAGWLGMRGFERTTRTGKTPHAGRYALRDGRSIVVNRASGRGDVVVEADLQFWKPRACSCRMIPDSVEAFEENRLADFCRTVLTSFVPSSWVANPVAALDIIGLSAAVFGRRQ